MSGERREHRLTVTLNKRRFARVVIDPHYQEKHPEMTDQLILELLGLLEGAEIEPSDETDGFVYLARNVTWQRKHYRIVLTYCDEDFLGVINAFRVKEKQS